MNLQEAITHAQNEVSQARLPTKTVQALNTMLQALTAQNRELQNNRETHELIKDIVDNMKRQGHISYPMYLTLRNRYHHVSQ